MPDMKFKPQGHDEPTGGYERRDINFKAVIGSGAALLFTMVATAFVLIFVDRWFTKWAGGLEEEPVSRLESKADRLPPLPRLQVSPREDMDAMLAEEKVRLEGYQYDEVTGVARIPVEVAIDLIAKQGLPTRIPQGDDLTSGTVAEHPDDTTSGPQESSSGAPPAGAAH